MITDGASSPSSGTEILYVLVGPMGSGKNYVGERLATHFKCPFLDGDSFIPTEMLSKVQKFKPLGQEDIDNYVTNYLIPGIAKHHNKSKKLVVSQALYREEHRNQLDLHFNCVFIYVRSPLLLNLKRLFSRENGLRWAIYGLCNRPFFQPSGLHYAIDNIKPDFDFKEDLVEIC